MENSRHPMLRWSLGDGVAIVEVLAREIQGPDAAAALGAGLEALLGSGQSRLLIDFERTRIMSSTAYGTLLNLWKRAEAAGGALRICSMDPSVRFGADIIGLGRYIPIHEDRASALDAFASITSS